MKLLIISAANDIHTVRWVNSLSERGHEVHLAYNSNHSPSINKLNREIKQYKLKYGGIYGYYLNAIQLKLIFNKIKPDIVNAHYASGYGTLVRIARLKRVLLSVWGSDIFIFPYKNKFSMKLIQKNINYADKIASTSECMARKVEEIMNKKMDIEITPFGVNIDKFKKIDTKNEKFKEDFIFGTVKSLKPVYGIDDIIKSFNLLKHKLNENKFDQKIKLHIYGKGTQENALRKLCFDLGIENDVIFKGYIPNDEVPNVINNIDVFCLGSISESFGVAAVEAMACETPIIATDAEGFTEVVEDKKSGYIVPKRNINFMSEKMYDLLVNDEIRVQMGKEGRKIVLEKYDWEKNVSTMEYIYEKLIERF